MFDAFVQEWVRRVWNESLEEGARALHELMASECVTEGIGDDIPPLTGPTPYEPFWRHFREAFPDLRCEVTEVISEESPSTGVVRFVMRGTHAGEFLDLPGTGKAIEVGGQARITLNRDGQATRIWNAFDIQTLLEQIGLAVDSVAKSAEASLRRDEPASEG